MSLLSGLFGNDSIKKLAFGQLTKLMKDENLSAIVLHYKGDGNELPDDVVPGFNVQMFRHPVSIYDQSAVAITADQMEDFRELASQRAYLSEQVELFQDMTIEQVLAWRDPEIKDTINRYLKAKKLNDGIDNTDETGDPDTNADSSGDLS